jgi:hypothetical protein
MATNSTTGDAGLDEDDYVLAGTFLGYENSVGCASGDHLHFEVAVSLDGGNLEFDEAGGHIDDDSAVNLIPVFCDISLNYFVSGEEYTAADCGSGCIGSLFFTVFTKSFDQLEVSISSATITGSTAVNFLNGSNGLWQAEDAVSLLPGFTAEDGCEFIARIEECNETPERLSDEFSIESMNEIPEFAALSIFPSPNTGIFQVSYKGSYNRLAVTNSVGQIVIDSGDGAANPVIDLSTHPKGIYFIGLRHDGGMEVERVVVQ